MAVQSSRNSVEVQQITALLSSPDSLLRDYVQTLDPGICAHTSINLSGTWARDWRRGKDVGEYIACHGQDKTSALAKSRQPYMQCWQKLELGWYVTTMKGDEVSPLRRMLYPYGHWKEKYEGPSTLFGVVTSCSPRAAEAQMGNIVTAVPRYTFWRAHEDAVGGLAHVTISHTTLGLEIAARYLTNETTMVLRRSLHRTGCAKEEFSCEEIFERWNYCENSATLYL